MGPPALGKEHDDALNGAGTAILRSGIDVNSIGIITMPATAAHGGGTPIPLKYIQVFVGLARSHFGPLFENIRPRRVSRNAGGACNLATLYFRGKDGCARLLVNDELYRRKQPHCDKGAN